MAAHPSTPPLDGDAHVRKRVGKACDRCRLKKSKCDGVIPCVRCKADNAICVFGERKKSHDKVYPKGYVEMLERQQTQLVTALQELYRRAVAGQEWDGPPLDDGGTGKPLTHDILDHLGLLHDRAGPVAGFDESFEAMQQRLIDDGADPMPRRSSPDSDNEQSQISGPDAQALLPTPPAPSPLSMQMGVGYGQWEADMDLAMLPPLGWAGSATKFDGQAVGAFPLDGSSPFAPLPALASYDPMVLTDDMALPAWTEDDFSTFLS